MKMGVKKIIIKKAMKLCERVPTTDDRSLSEIFRHESFINGGEQERKRIMLESSEFLYLYELQHPFDLFFKLDLVLFLKGKVTLDLGCFTGGRSVAWYERYKLDKIYGIDPHYVHIKAAQQFAKIKGTNAEFICSRGENLPFKDEKFDAILGNDVFEHVQDVKQVLSESNRVLKKKGKLFVAFPSYFNPIEHHLWLVTRTPFIHYFSSGKDLVDLYNEIIDERGGEANWYKRQNSNLEPWEKCNTINGTTKAKFQHLVRDTGWNIYYEHNPSLLSVGGIVNKYPVLKLISYVMTPFAWLPIFEEFLCCRIVYILEK